MNCIQHIPHIVMNIDVDKVTSSLYVSCIREECTRHETTLNKLGSDYHKNVIEPFESKFNVKYIAGNGDYYFISIPEEDRIFPDEQSNHPMYKELTEIYSVLDQQVAYDDYFAYYV